ncbi:MAG: glycosyltransferase family 4 protein [Cyanobium sp.]
MAAASPSACIYYHPDGYVTEGRQIMGRHAAGASFLRGFLEATCGEELWIQLEDSRHAAGFEQQARALGRTEPLHVVDRHRLGRLRQAGVVFHSGPDLAREAHHRSLFGDRSWSLCGLTHTTCTAGVMDAITSFLTAPVQPWDALICTSQAVRAQVEQLLAAQEEWLRQRLGITRVTLPQLPVLPLGLHCEDFQTTAADRDAARRQLGVSDDTLVVLFIGRLSFHAKAHPLALYQALQRAAEAAGVPVHLVECGWHANEPILAAYAQAARIACPSVAVTTLDGLDAAQRRQAWAGADVFCSLVDNIQETFGITPVEAMASGLPVVVSDWDGYRDTVRDGLDGFRIPTCMPHAGLGGDLAARHALGQDNYDQYIANTCAFVAVDVEATAAAFTRLFRSPELRRSLGEAGRQRAREQFDWRALLPRYQELWRELNAIRTRSADTDSAVRAWPARPDPYAAFAAYPSERFGLETRLGLVDGEVTAAAERLRRLGSLEMVRYAEALLPSSQELIALLQAIGPRGATAQALLAPAPPQRRALLFRSLLWLLKLNVIRRLPPQG